VPRPSISHLQRQTRKQKSHLGPRGRRCEGDRGGSCLGLSEADSTHIAQRVASPMLRPRPPQHAPASAMPAGVTRTHDAAARGRRARPWPWRRRTLRRFRPKLPLDNQARIHARPPRACAHHPLRRCSALTHSTPRPLSALRGTGRRGAGAVGIAKHAGSNERATRYLGARSPEGAAPAATARRHASTIGAMAQPRSLPP